MGLLKRLLLLPLMIDAWLLSEVPMRPYSVSSVQPGLSLASKSASVTLPSFLQCKVFRSSSRCCCSMGINRNWDEILREEEKSSLDDNDDRPFIPFDMKYIPRNVMRQHQNYLSIREAGGKDLIHDIYVRDPKTSAFWFIGKVARVSDVTLEQCIARQWSLITTHATNLRPLELIPARKLLEVWTAPGDSEVEVAYNRPYIIFQKMHHEIESVQPLTSIKNSLIGFSGEVYQPGEDGFRTWRLEDGSPMKPELQSPSARQEASEYIAPTEEELKDIQKKLDGKDINEVFKVQQKREGKPVD